MPKYKKPAPRTGAAVVLIAAAVSFALTACVRIEAKPENPTNKTAAPSQAPAAVSPSPEPAYKTSYEKVTVEFLSEHMGFKSRNKYETTDLKAVAYIDREINSAMASSDKTDLKNNYTYEYTIKLSNKAGGYSAGLYYDTLYNKAYIVNNGGLWLAKTDFARYIDSLLENTPTALTPEDAGAVDLFRRYGWTLDYRMNAMKNKLNEIRTLYGFNPNAYYFAYNNELSKDIGLDMSGYANTADIEVDIYKIHEPMPREFYPIQNCRGIVVKNGGKIIGAFISAGRHSVFAACSLNGKGFEGVTGRKLDDWLADKVKADGAEVSLSKLEPEQVIREYFTALGNKDAQAAQGCVSKLTLLGHLTANMPNGELFSEVIALPLTDADIRAKSYVDNVKSAKLLETKLFSQPNEKTKRFAVTVDLQYIKTFTLNNGIQSWDCTMVYESPQTGWKIKEFGHG